MVDFNQSLVNVKAFYAQNVKKSNVVIDIMLLCRLYPIDDWRHWTDHCGQTLSIADDKKLSIIKNKSKEYIITDLYYKSYPKQILDISDKAVLNDNNIWALGKDNRLRSLLYKDKVWINCAPLSSFNIKELYQAINVLLNKETEANNMKLYYLPKDNEIIKERFIEIT
jgi:hypothetical protein